MKKKEFCSLNLSRLGNDDASGLCQLTLDVATPVEANIGGIAQVALANLKASATPFIVQTNCLRLSPLTAKINNVRIFNNELLAEIKRIIVFETKSRTEDRKAAALDLDYFFKPYWDLSRRALGTQITDTNELISKYEADAAIVAKAKKIGIDIPMLDLKSNTVLLNTLFFERNQEVGGRSTSGTDLRPQAMEEYNQFCEVIEQSVNLLPNETLLTLFNNMDELRIRSRALITKPKDKPEDEGVKA